MFCKKCGAALSDEAKFCKVCGVAVGAAPVSQPMAGGDGWIAASPAAPRNDGVAPAYQPPPAPVYQQPAYSYPQLVQPMKKKLNRKTFIGVAIPAAVAVILFFALSGGKSDPVKPDPVKPDENPLSISYSYQDKEPKPIISFTALEELYPSGYRTLDSLVTFTGYCDYGETDILIEVEVPGFTQLYKQKIHLGSQMTKLRIVPPLIPGDLGDLDLSSGKVAQLAYSATDVNTGKLLVQESQNLQLYSIYDMVWGNKEHSRAYIDNILAWMTPDAPEILELSRLAIDYMSENTGGRLRGMYGYQDYHYFDNKYDNTWIQAVALQGAMGDKVGIRYNKSSFTLDSMQRVKLPADTISSRSGLCIETSLVMATALQAAGMHVLIIFPPAHAQVAVEAWPDTGDYYLIETTRLPMGNNNESWRNTVMYKDKDAWNKYIAGTADDVKGPCYVLDCDLGKKLGIRPITN